MRVTGLHSGLTGRQWKEDGLVATSSYGAAVPPIEERTPVTGAEGKIRLLRQLPDAIDRKSVV